MEFPEFRSRPVMRAEAQNSGCRKDFQQEMKKSLSPDRTDPPPKDPDQYGDVQHGGERVGQRQTTMFHRPHEEQAQNDVGHYRYGADLHRRPGILQGVVDLGDDADFSEGPESQRIIEESLRRGNGRRITEIPPLEKSTDDGYTQYSQTNQGRYHEKKDQPHSACKGFYHTRDILFSGMLRQCREHGRGGGDPEDPQRKLHQTIGEKEKGDAPRGQKRGQYIPDKDVDLQNTLADHAGNHQADDAPESAMSQ